MKIYTNFLLNSNKTIFLPLDKVQNSSFNYVSFKEKNIVSNDNVFISVSYTHLTLPTIYSV